MDNCADEVYNRDNLWYAELGGESGMKDKVYMAIDLSNAEGEEMPILSVTPFKRKAITDNIGITCYT